MGRTARTWTYQLDVKTLAGWKTVRKSVGRIEDESYRDARREAELAMVELCEITPLLRIAVASGPPYALPARCYAR